MRGNTEKGFAGAVSALSVADVLQLQKANDFSGSVVFSHEEQQAIVFVQHGDVVHAELGDAKGEDAVRAILAWPTGAFETHANVTTFAKTVEKRLDHLLLDCARRLDEERRSDAPASAATPPPLPLRPPARPAAGIVERARSVPDVTHAVVIRDGAPVGDPSPEGEALAARSEFLASMIAAPLGKLLGLGDLQRAAIRSKGEQLVLLRSPGGNTLAVSFAGGVPLLEREAALRAALGARKGR